MDNVAFTLLGSVCNVNKSRLSSRHTLPPLHSLKTQFPGIIEVEAEGRARVLAGMLAYLDYIGGWFG